MNRGLLFILFLTLISCQPDKERQEGICISFDDRSIREWYGMRELLNEYDARVTFFVTQFDSLDSTEIRMLKELEKDGHEIGSHGALHVQSERYIKERSYNEYLANEIEASITSMKKQGFTPKSFAYPYGAKYWFTDFLLRSKFEILRGVEPINKERDLTLIDNIYYTYNGDRTPQSMGIDQNNALTNEMIDKAMKRAVDNKEVLMLYGHSPIADSENGDYNFDLATLEYILKQSKEMKLKFMRYQDIILN